MLFMLLIVGFRALDASCIDVVSSRWLSSFEACYHGFQLLEHNQFLGQFLSGMVAIVPLVVSVVVVLNNFVGKLGKDI